MNILYVWSDNYPWDIRVEKICNTLLDDGHDVHLLAANNNGGAKFETIKNLKIHRLPHLKLKPLNKIINFPIFLNPLWAIFSFILIKRYKISLLINRDLPLALASIIVGKVNHVPTIFDMAEIYPEMFRSRYQVMKKKGIVDKIIRNVPASEVIQKIAVKFSDHILVVVDEAIKKISPKSKYNNKISVVSNTPVMASYLQINKSMINKYKDLVQNKFVIIYHGGTTIIRGIQMVFESIEKIKVKTPKLLFIIVGPKENYLLDIIKEKKLENFVHMSGWLDMADIFALLENCHCGIIPHIRTSHSNHTIPNKLFDYMACGLPVITNNIEPVKRIVNEVRCGFVYNNVDELSQILENIYTNPKLEEYSKRGKIAVENKYNWNIDKAKLLQVVNQYTTSNK